VIHKAGSNGSAVDKTVTYTPVSSTVTGAAKCWITQNLGADREATGVNDATEASAGWYWQFNTLQGYKLDGAVTTPNTTWTAVIPSDSQWLLANDPCAQLLGGGWRIPTATEWNTAGTTKNWEIQANGFASELKLHGAGYSYATPAKDRGTATYFWTATQATNANAFFYYNGSATRADTKSYSFPVRCLRDGIVETVPSLSNVLLPASGMTATTFTGSAVVNFDGGSPVTARGLVWNTTGTPTLADHVVPAGTGIGEFTTVISGVEENKIYYVRAYATNSSGTGYSLVKKIRICLPVTVVHKAGENGSAVDKTVTYKTINTDFTGTDKCWITQNLGADREASALNDATEASSGWYWQFNKLQGIKSDGGTMTPGTAWVTSISENSDWLPANDPCARLLGWGWRIPASTEFVAVAKAPQNWTGMAMAFESPLKFHYGGYLLYTNGALTGRGTANDYWTSNQSGATTGTYINDVKDLWTVNPKTYGFTIRCLKDIVAKAAPVVSNAVLPSSAMTASSATGSADVTADGGSPVTARGLVWNTSGNPTLSDHVVPAGSGPGIFNAVISDLTKNTVYYVRAYATNEIGTGYSPIVTKVMICLPVTVVHQAGVNGSAISKTVTYNTVNAGFSGTEKCWIAQNLGADVAATSSSDVSDAAAGWYW
ncbi:MAG: fibrobacter succinogenes major paralogous domain-containing protein, partial [Pedobacter sp.]|nr:fibrobacter succinogenes major paralogous domain-containing protein [Pedobacter sp.]